MPPQTYSDSTADIGTQNTNNSSHKYALRAIAMFFFCLILVIVAVSYFAFKFIPIRAKINSIENAENKVILSTDNKLFPQLEISENSRIFTLTSEVKAGEKVALKLGSDITVNFHYQIVGNSWIIDKIIVQNNSRARK